jgi:hypothetical protein
MTFDDLQAQCKITSLNAKSKWQVKGLRPQYRILLQ